MSNNSNYRIVYLICEHEFLKKCKKIYKLGYDMVDNPGNKIIISDKAHYYTYDMIKQTFDIKYKKRTDIGKNYYEGDSEEMRNIIINLINEERNYNCNCLVNSLCYKCFNRINIRMYVNSL